MARAALVTVLIVVFGLYGCENGAWDDRGFGEPADTTEQTTEEQTGSSTEDSTADSTEDSTADVPDGVEAGLPSAETARSSADGAASISVTTCRMLIQAGERGDRRRLVDAVASHPNDDQACGR